MEREKFEDSWKNAFQGKEISPSQNVWTNVELELEKARGEELKRRVFFYKMLAAACVVFAMAIGGAGYYHSLSPGGAFNLADNNGVLPADVPSSTGTFPDAADTSPSSDIAQEKTSGVSQDSDHPQTEIPAPPGDEAITSEGKQAIRVRGGDGGYEMHEQATNVAGAKGIAFENRRPDGDVFTPHDKTVPPLYTPREIRLNFAREGSPTVDPVVAMMAKLERREKELQGQQRQKDKSASGDEKLWTSIGFAAGSFNSMTSSAAPASGSGSAAFAMAAAPIVDQETTASGYSYTMGLNVGTKLSARWVLQGGVNYLTHASEYTADNVVMEPMGKMQQRFRAASTNDLVNADEAELSNKLVYSAPYTVNNSMRYLSIPMQAGYLIVNKTFGLQLNAGVATDLFLQNTVRAESDQLATTSQPSGSGSPYRAVNLSGLFGTEFSYRFGPHYRISLNPGLRYPFNTIYKSELGVQSIPLTFDVGLRFRYIFN